MLRNHDRSYGLPAIALHWTVAALFFGQVALGFVMLRVDSMALQFTLIQWHKSFGFLILGLSLARLAWGLTNRSPGPLLGSSRMEWLAAVAVHRLLYALLVVTPLAGWALASTSTLGIPSFVFDLFVMPDLPMARTDAAEAFWRQAHAVLAYATFALACGHVLAALRHHFKSGGIGLGRMLGTRLRVTTRTGDGS